MKVQLIFRWYDFWIGFFWDRGKRYLYFFPIPMFDIVFKFNIYAKYKDCRNF